MLCVADMLAAICEPLEDETIHPPTALLAGARDAYDLTKVRGTDLRDTLAWPGTWEMFAPLVAYRRC